MSDTLEAVENEIDELTLIRNIMKKLEALDPKARQRVMNYLNNRLAPPVEHDPDLPY